jgi:hypothetical protein
LPATAICNIGARSYLLAVGLTGVLAAWFAIVGAYQIDQLAGGVSRVAISGRGGEGEGERKGDRD